MARMFINGTEVDSVRGETYEVKNPANGTVVDTVPHGNREDAKRAVDAAESALAAWSGTEPDERARILRKGIAAVEQHAKDIAALLTAEQGKPLIESNGELHHFLHGMEFYSGLASKIRGSQAQLPQAFGKHAYGIIVRRPVGVCAGIVPWNFPLTLMGTKVGPALIAGNTLVIKPASSTPLATLRVISLLHEAGLPPGVLNCITGPGSEVGEGLISDPRVRRVAITGSTPTGRRVMELAGPDFKRITLELGGSDPMIVCPDADIRRAVSGAIIGRFWNAGQACLAVKRLYLFEPIYDEFLDALVKKVHAYVPGDPTTRPEKPQIRIGPLHTAHQRDEVEAQLDDARERGARVLVGGRRPDNPDLKNGHFYEPAVVVDVPEESRLAREEVFGPVLPVWKVDSLDEAIQKANNSHWGLGSSIWTQNLSWANRAVRELDCGMTWVNQIHYGYDELPFGGTKASGLGHEHGPEAVDYYLENKSAVFGGLDWD